AGRIPTVLNFTLTPSPSTLGQLVAMNVIANPATATGKVTFFDGANLLIVLPLVNGQATLATSLLTSGVHTLRTYYPGDFDDGPATSVRSHTVIALPQN